MRTGLETREELFAVMEQIAEEREAARPIVRELVARGQSIDDIEIPEGWRTAGMVLELADFAYDNLETDARKSLSFSLLSAAIATGRSAAESPESISRYLEGRSWQVIGWSHRYLNRYDAANMAFKTAQSKFSESPALSYEVAAIVYARASVLLLEMDFAAAINLIEAAREKFRDLGVVRRQIHCDILRAMADWRVGNFEGARSRYERALGLLSDSDDPYTIASICNGLGRIYLVLGRKSDAVTTLERASEIFAGLELPSEVSRANWGLAQVSLEMGDARHALLLLKPIRQDFLNRNMPEEAGEVGLHIVDALVKLGKSDEAKALAAEVLKEFVDAKLSVYAIGALGYLRDLLETTENAQSAVRHVRSYVERLQEEPKLLFLPLDEKQ